MREPGSGAPAAKGVVTMPIRAEISSAFLTVPELVNRITIFKDREISLKSQMKGKDAP